MNLIQMCMCSVLIWCTVSARALWICLKTIERFFCKPDEVSFFSQKLNETFYLIYEYERWVWKYILNFRTHLMGDKLQKAYYMLHMYVCVKTLKRIFFDFEKGHGIKRVLKWTETSIRTWTNEIEYFWLLNWLNESKKWLSQKQMGMYNITVERKMRSFISVRVVYENRKLHTMYTNRKDVKHSLSFAVVTN